VDELWVGGGGEDDSGSGREKILGGLGLTRWWRKT